MIERTVRPLARRVLGRRGALLLSPSWRRGGEDDGLHDPFSIGITKGKWVTLLNARLEFKRDVTGHASTYADLGLRRYLLRPVPEERLGSRGVRLP